MNTWNLALIFQYRFVIHSVRQFRRKHSEQHQTVERFKRRQLNLAIVRPNSGNKSTIHPRAQH